MTIQVHEYELRDGVEVCGYCGEVRDRERVAPRLCRGTRPVTQREKDLETRVQQLEAALHKINDIRNSLIGLQTFNWSEHAYPLVAALDAAGFEGMNFDAAFHYYGSLLDRAVKAEGALATARLDVWREVERIIDRSDVFEVIDALREAIEAAKETAK